MIQEIFKNPNIRIFISNERLDNAKSFLREIKSHFEKNQELRSLFGDYTNFEEKWTETQIVVKKRTVNLKEPTIQVGSLDTSLVSQHFDLIILDDLVSRNNTQTREQIEKVVQYWKDAQSLLEVNGTIVLLGTRWHYDDLYGYVMQENPYLKVFKRAAIDEYGKALFPGKFDEKALARIKNQIGNYDWSCLYQNEPVDEESATFKRSFFNTKFREIDLQGKRLATYITYDIAESKTAGADYTGIVVNSVDKENNWYFRKVVRFKGTISELIEKIFELHAQYKPLRHGFEKGAFEFTILPFLQEEMKRRNTFINVEKLKHGGRRKEDRISGALSARFQNSAIFLQEFPTDNTVDMIDELCRFPKSKWDDLSDAAAYQENIARAPYGNKAWENPEEMMFYKKMKEKKRKQRRKSRSYSLKMA